MVKSITHITVSYADTDQMGFVHHSNYLRYYENARWEFFRQNEMCYKEIEQQGILLPVIDAKLKYIKPARYDDILEIHTSITKISGVRIVFSYQIFNQNTEILNVAEVTVASIDKTNNKATRLPEHLLKKVTSKQA